MVCACAQEGTISHHEAGTGNHSWKQGRTELRWMCAVKQNRKLLKVKPMDASDRERWWRNTRYAEQRKEDDDENLVNMDFDHPYPLPH